MKDAPAIIILVLALGAGACGPNQRIIESANENQSATTKPASGNTEATLPPASFDQDLEAMRTADFNFIYVLRRPDGQPLTSEDRSFISSATPMEVNRRRVSDGGRAVILGSNFRLPPESLPVFKGRFAVEDYSKPESEIVNANSNR